jgi:hypothetical protein
MLKMMIPPVHRQSPIPIRTASRILSSRRFVIPVDSNSAAHPDEADPVVEDVWPISDPDSPPAQDFLASIRDLVNALDHFGSFHRVHSLQRRLDEETSREALAKLVWNIPGAGQPPPQAAMVPEAVPSGPPKSQGSGRRMPRGPERSPSHGQQRQHCKCGRCRWCLENARWDRIFNEKFADPAYYADPVCKHSSPLAGVS